MCLARFWEGSGLQGSRFDVSHIVFLGKVGWECQSWATVVPSNSGKDPVESLERTKKESGSRWNALIAIERPGRIPGYLAYGRKAKWIPMERTLRPPPKDFVQSDPGHCGSLIQVGKGGSLCGL